MFEGIGVAALTLLAGTLGYFADRWITGRPEREKTEGALQSLELMRRLREEGVSIEEVQTLSTSIREGRLRLTPVQVGALNRQAPEPEAPLDTPVIDDTMDYSIADTTVGMRLGLGNRLTELQGKIDLAVAELRYRASPARIEAFDKAQRAWERYAEKEADVAGLLYEGGTGRPVLTLSRHVALAEERLAGLQQQIRDEAGL